mgnify:CR=1 FL=1|tara:strand:+ start:27 stop:563 length:537 start_codon:yes stop_codon:yes gene_type:complete
MSTLKVNNITNTSGNPDIGNVGKILQIQSTTKTDSYSATSTSTATDITGLSVNITPTGASHKVLVLFNVSMAVDSNFGGQGIILVRNSTQICMATDFGSRTPSTIKAIGGGASSTYYAVSHGQNFLDSPNTTNQVTYKLQHIDASTNNGIYINREYYSGDSAGYGRYTSSITVFELAA